ncbi:MAG: serine/threonine-protein kinase [Pseudonocardiales bacterium]|nr:serine/threonine-protein kinase [Pseudonocardiales bacterium]
MQPGPDDPTRRMPDATRRFDGPPRSGAHAAPDAPAPGRVLGGRYRLAGLLGSGGMADVFRAEDLRLHRPVAVKLFRPGTDPDGERRFEQEAQTLAGLRHPGLVAVHDVGVEQGHAYLVMELVDGPTLAQELTRERYDAAGATQIGLELARVLAHVHDEGIVHRDVKPSNILVEQDGRVRLADFGISQLTGASGMTSAGETVGTAAYLSPEQVRGAAAGPPSDVYALGLVLLECLSGRPEYPGSGWDAAEERLRRAPAVPRDLPEPLRGTLGAMTAAEPERRPTARAVAAALSHGPVEPEPGPRGGTLRTVLIAALVVALLVIAGFALTSARDEPTDPAAQPATSAAPAEEPTEEPTEEPAAEPTEDAPPTEDGSAGDGSGGLPSLPDLPTELPDLPTDLPDLPEIPQPVQDDARNLWERFTDWFSGLFG